MYDVGFVVMCVLVLYFSGIVDFELFGIRLGWYKFVYLIVKKE